jgi:multiple RNA-binding domain-containing protein 1
MFINSLFSSAYGQLKTVRLPKKVTGGHRGFAFVEFVNQQEAKNAMEHLANTHLYGRHLVIETAQDVTDLDEMRKRVDEQYSKYILLFIYLHLSFILLICLRLNSLITSE